MAEGILSLSEAERAYMWENFRRLNERLTGIDPNLFNDFYPKLDKTPSGNWPELKADSLDFHRDMRFPSGSQLSLVKRVLSGETIDFFPKGAAAGPVAVKVEPEEVVAEKLVFHIVLKGYKSDKKVSVIKEVKNIMAIGLKEAKDQVEGAEVTPVTIIKNLEKALAEETLKKLTDLGAIVELI